MARAFVKLPTEQEYKRFFAPHQTGQGGSEPYYIGLPKQRGFGPASFLWNLIGSRLIPFVKQIPTFFRSDQGKKLTRTVAKHLVNTGAQIVSDRLGDNGVPWKKSAKHRFGELGDTLVDEARTVVQKQQGSGKRIKGQCPNGNRSVGSLKRHRGGISHSSKKRRKRDIFDK
jgi:hypothetical protein